MLSCWDYNSFTTFLSKMAANILTDPVIVGHTISPILYHVLVNHEPTLHINLIVLYHSLCAYYVGYNNYNVDYKLQGMAIDCIMCEPVISYIHPQFPAKSLTYFVTLVTTGYKYIWFVDDVNKYYNTCAIYVDRNNKWVDHSIWALGERKVLTIGYRKSSFIYKMLLLVLYQWILKMLIFIGDYNVATHNSSFF